MTNIDLRRVILPNSIANRIMVHLCLNRPHGDYTSHISKMVDTDFAGCMKNMRVLDNDGLIKQTSKHPKKDKKKKYYILTERGRMVTTQVIRIMELLK